MLSNLVCNGYVSACAMMAIITGHLCAAVRTFGGVCLPIHRTRLCCSSTNVKHVPCMVSYILVCSGCPHVYM